MRNLMIFLAVAVLAVSLAFFTGARTALPADVRPAQEAGQSERAGEPAAERSDPGEEPATEEEPSERPTPEGPARRGKAGPEGREHPDKDGLRSAPSRRRRPPKADPDPGDGEELPSDRSGEDPEGAVQNPDRPGKLPHEHPIIPPLPPVQPRESEAGTEAEQSLLGRYAMVTAEKDGAEISSPGELLVCFSDRTVTCLYRSADRRTEWRCEREYVRAGDLITAADPALGQAWTFRVEDERVTWGKLDLGGGTAEVGLMREKPTAWWRWMAEWLGRCPMPLRSRCGTPELPQP